MPTYDFRCQKCGNVFESILRLFEYEGLQWPVCSECGTDDIVRHFVSGCGGVQCDSINDVSWLPSAIKNLPDDAVGKVGSRGEWKRYLKEKGLICTG